MKVLLTGIAGKMGQLVCAELLERSHEVIGIDRRGWSSAPSGVSIHCCDMRKRAAEEVFRHELPEAVIHMATVTHLTAKSEERYRINLEGTRALFDYCAKYGVKSCVFVGRHTYYGAGPQSPLYHHEDDPPNSINLFPELSDLIAADLYAGNALWRVPDLKTAVLRICYTLGPARHGTLAAFLASPHVPTVWGFDPLFQFIHESDAARAIVLALEHRLRGIYNVAGPKPVPLSILIRETGGKRLPLPETLFQSALGHFGFPKLPKGALSHIKWPIVMEDSRFREATSFEPKFDAATTIASYREALPVAPRF